jgi:hypothetical protein
MLVNGGTVGVGVMVGVTDTVGVGVTVMVGVTDTVGVGVGVGVSVAAIYSRTNHPPYFVFKQALTV